jgi:hypothetical protein
MMMLKLLQGPRPGKADALPAVYKEPPPPSVNEDCTKFVGPARTAVAMMLVQFRSHAETKEEGDFRVAGLAEVVAEFPNEVVVAACRWMLKFNPNGSFPVTSNLLYDRCREIRAKWRNAAWYWLDWDQEARHGSPPENPWETKPCSIELLDAWAVEFATAGRYDGEYSDMVRPAENAIPVKFWRPMGGKVSWMEETRRAVRGLDRWERILRAMGRYDAIKADLEARIAEALRESEERERRHKEEAAAKAAEVEAKRLARLEIIRGEEERRKAAWDLRAKMDAAMLDPSYKPMSEAEMKAAAEELGV